MQLKIHSSNRSKFISYVSANPKLKVHSVHMKSDNYIPEYARTSFTRLRLSSHHLKIETGRWSRTPRESRLCDCPLNAMQDEQHVVKDCVITSSVRDNFPDIICDFPDFYNGNDDLNLCLFIHNMFETLK